MTRSALFAACGFLLTQAPLLAQGVDADRLREILVETVTSQRASRLDMTGDPTNAEDSEALLRLRQALKARRVTVHFEDTPFSECIDFLHEITGLNIVVSRLARETLEDDETKISLRLRDVRLKNCWELLLKQSHKDLRYGIRHGVLYVGMKEEWKEDSLILRMIPVDDILHQPPDFPGPRMGIGKDGAEFDWD